MAKQKTTKPMSFGTTSSKSASSRSSTSKTSATKKAAKSANTKSTAQSNFGQAATGNIFDSDFVDDMRSNFEKVVNSSNVGMCGNMDCITENNKLIQKLINDLGKQMGDVLNQQIQLGIKSLSCRTMSDAIDLAQSGFKNNFDNSMKFNNQLFDIMKHCQMNNLKHTKKCMGGSL